MTLSELGQALQNATPTAWGAMITWGMVLTLFFLAAVLGENEKEEDDEY